MPFFKLQIYARQVFSACSLAKAYIGSDSVSIDVSFYFNLNDNIELVI